MKSRETRGTREGWNKLERPALTEYDHDELQPIATSGA